MTSSRTVDGDELVSNRVLWGGLIHILLLTCLQITPTSYRGQIDLVFLKTETSVQIGKHVRC